MILREENKICTISKNTSKKIDDVPNWYLNRYHIYAGCWLIPDMKMFCYGL
jgi:hypothetical protein